MTDLPPSHKLYIPKTPVTYTLELTSHCNNACLGCGNVFARDLGEMPTEQWEYLLGKLQPHIVNLRMTGGEPTLHPQFSQMIQVVDCMNVPWVLFSNGVWKNRQEIIQSLLRCHNLDGVLISLHGQNPYSHQQFTGCNLFAETILSIQEAARAGVSINTNTVLTRANLGEIEKITRLSLDLGSGFVAFSRYYGIPRPITALSDDELREAIESIHTLQTRGLPVRFNNNVPACFSGYRGKSCPAGITHCTIDPLGNVRPCNHTDVVLGNLFEHSIEELWCSDKASRWRGLIPQACYQCTEFDDCRGGCKAMALQMAQTHDPLMCQPVTERPVQDKPRKLALYRNAMPVKNFVIRREEFGFMLVNRSRILLVDLAAEPLLNLLDGAHSLHTIKQQFGQEGLNFVGLLYQEGLVRLDNGLDFGQNALLDDGGRLA